MDVHKKRQLRLGAVVLTLLVLLLSGCGDSRLVGKWEYVKNKKTTYEFTSKGTFTMNAPVAGAEDLPYSVMFGKITMGSGRMKSTMKYTIEGDNLTLHYGSSTNVFKRVKAGTK